MIQRIETQNKKGYKIKRKPRKKPVLPVNKKPVVIGQVVSDKVPRKEPPQIETADQKDPADKKELKLEKKIEKKKHPQKMTKTNHHATGKTKPIKKLVGKRAHNTSASFRTPSRYGLTVQQK